MRALETLGVRRLVVATSYIDEVTNHLVKYLTDSGFEVAGATGLGFTTIAEMHGVDTPTLVELCERTYAQAPHSDAILLSCGGLFTLDAVPIVETNTGVPLVSSSPAGYWDVVRTAGMEARVEGEGRMLAGA